MSELTEQIQEVSDNLDQLSSDTQSTLDDHASTLDNHEQTLSDVKEKNGQLDFPLTPDSIQRIKEVFPSGSATLASGTATVKDANIQASSTVIYCVSTSNIGSVIAVGNNHVGYSYTLSDGQIIFISTINTDSSVINYVIF